MRLQDERERDEPSNFSQTSAKGLNGEAPPERDIFFRLSVYERVAISLDCKTIRIFAYSSTREQSNKRSGTRLKTESETGERR